MTICLQEITKYSNALATNDLLIAYEYQSKLQELLLQEDIDIEDYNSLQNEQIILEILQCTNTNTNIFIISRRFQVLCTILKESNGMKWNNAIISTTCEWKSSLLFIFQYIKENFNTNHIDTIQYDTLEYLITYLQTLEIICQEKMISIEIFTAISTLQHDISEIYCDISCNCISNLILKQFLQFQRQWRHYLLSIQSQSSNKTINVQNYIHNWCEWSFNIQIHMGCYYLALKEFSRIISLQNTELQEMEYGESFISIYSPYSFLLVWIQFTAEWILTILLYAKEEEFNWSSKYFKRMEMELRTSTMTRKNLLSILSEHDDIMIIVLDLLLQIYEKFNPLMDKMIETNAPEDLLNYWRLEFDPDIFFHELLLSFGFDHTILLDMLTNGETPFLEYLLHYLRYLVRLSGNVSHDKKEVVSINIQVLTQLQESIERLVRFDLFPYDPAPLLRRLKQIETLFN